MRRRFLLIAQCLGLIAAPAYAGARPAFRSLKQATVMLDGHIAARDRAALLAECKAYGGCEYFSGHPEVFDLLVAAWNRVGPFENLYGDQEFPRTRDEFKLGGHQSELGHVHIDFVKRDGAWTLKDIWNCR